MVQIWLGFALVAAGIWFFISPSSAADFKKNLVKTFGGKLTGGKKLTSTYKWVGIALFAVGLILLLS